MELEDATTTVAAGAGSTSVVDKWSGAEIERVPMPTGAELGSALDRADAAWRAEWSQLDRSRALARAAALLERRRSEIAAAMVRETGFTTREVENEITRAGVTLELCAEEATRLCGTVVPLAASEAHVRSLAFTVRHPRGVVLAITPFNFPLNGPCHKVGPALAGGNSVILKPSEVAPLAALALAEILWESGVPRDRLQVVVGPGEDVAMPLMSDERVAFTTFTGSTRVGEIVKRTTGVRPCALELGSVSPTIVCADADLDRAVPAIVRGAFHKAGQVCTSVQLVCVHESVADQLTAGLVDATARLRCGDPSDGGTDMGPVIDAAAAARIEALIAAAVDDGAAIATGGTREGTLVAPTVLTGVADTSPLHREEAFGPLVGVLAFSELSDVVAQLNANPYGLQAGIFTRDTELALTAALTLQTGSVVVNGTPTTRADAMPFGGEKRSGYGKEGPAYAIREMTVERLVMFTR